MEPPNHDDMSLEVSQRSLEISQNSPVAPPVFVSPVSETAIATTASNAMTRLCAAVLTQHGIRSIRLSGLQVIASTISFFLCTLGRAAKAEAELSRRGSANLYDVVVALTNLSPELVNKLFASDPPTLNSEEIAVHQTLGFCRVYQSNATPSQTTSRPKEQEETLWKDYDQDDANLNQGIWNAQRQPRVYVELGHKSDLGYYSSEPHLTSQRPHYQNLPFPEAQDDMQNHHAPQQHGHPTSLRSFEMRQFSYRLPSHLPALPPAVAGLIPLAGYTHSDLADRFLAKSRRHDKVLEDNLHVQMLLPKVIQQHPQIISAELLPSSEDSRSGTSSKKDCVVSPKPLPTSSNN